MLDGRCKFIFWNWEILLSNKGSMSASYLTLIKGVSLPFTKMTLLMWTSTEGCAKQMPWLVSVCDCLRVFVCVCMCAHMCVCLRERESGWWIKRDREREGKREEISMWKQRMNRKPNPQLVCYVHHEHIKLKCWMPGRFKVKQFIINFDSTVPCQLKSAKAINETNQLHISLLPPSGKVVPSHLLERTINKIRQKIIWDHANFIAQS
jgi:hypothetical protein